MKINKTITNACELWIEATDIEQDDNHVFFEFLQGDDLEIKKASIIPELLKVKLPNDGLYNYYLIKVPIKENCCDDIIYCKKYNDTYLLYSGLSEITTFNQLCDILSNVEYIYEPIFSICKLQNCLENKLRKRVHAVLTSCTTGKCVKNEDNEWTQFLFITIYLLKQLICQSKYTEATNILNKINRCEGICKDLNALNNCNCN